jgi:hypothetical protein
MSTATVAYNHPKLQELIKKAQATPGIGQLIFQAITDVVHPQDRILACHYYFDSSGGSADPGGAYYTFELVLITSAYYISITFYPKLHSIQKRRIHAISDIKVEYQSPSSDDLKKVSGGRFYPSSLSVSLSFVNEHGENVDSWSVEVTQPESVRSLYDTSRWLSKCIGIPLAQIPVPEASK